MREKFIAVTQREVFLNDHGETRDSLDRRWYGFFKKCDLIPILLPNDLKIAKQILQEFNITKLLLTGGGDIKSCGGSDFLREEVEDFLIDQAAANQDFTLLGVCRGMQKIQDHFGVKNIPVQNHIMTKQKILVNKNEEEVNSFHNFGTKKNNDQFDVFAIADDGVIKGVKHKKYNITGIMWHPERIEPYRLQDIQLFQKIF